MKRIFKERRGFLMKRKVLIKESNATLESAIAKSLCGANLMPSEFDEIVHLTNIDLMSNHGLDHLMSEKVKLHVQNEANRLRAQSLMTWEVESREGLQESKTIVTELHDELSYAPEDIMDVNSDSQDGRMLDYGDNKSDSHEGRMVRQALFEIGAYANELHDMLSDDDDLPQWCHYKIAVARSTIGKVKHYLEYKIKNPKN